MDDRTAAELPPVYIITLQSDQRRVDHVHDALVPSLRRLGFEDIVVHAAVEGRTNDLEKSLAAHNLTPTTAFLRKCKRGQLACYASHFAVWQAAMERGLDRVLILEDDAIVNDGAEADLGLILAELPEDAGVLWLYTPKHQLRNGPSVSVPGLQHLNKAYNQWCLVAYLLTRTYMSRIVELLREMRCPVDNALNVLAKRGTVPGYSCKAPPFACTGQLGRSLKNESLSSNIWTTGGVGGDFAARITSYSEGDGAPSE